MINNFENIDNEIINLDNEGNLDIFSIENLLINNIESYKKELHKHVEDVLCKCQYQNLKKCQS